MAYDEQQNGGDLLIRTAGIFAMDLFMDLGMLLAVQLCFSNFRPLRLVLAQLMLFACTLAVVVCNIPDNARAFLHLPVLLLSSAVATGEHRPARLAEIAAGMYCFGALLAGLYVPDKAMLPRIIAGISIMIILLHRRRNLKCRWNIEIRIEKNGVSAIVPALIDTGNRLREHRSNLPVLILEESAAPELFISAMQLNPDELRLLPYGVLGSAGEIPCFRPDVIEIYLSGNKTAAAPDCWAAFFPGRIPGKTRALAPPEFTEVFQ